MLKVSSTVPPTEILSAALVSSTCGLVASSVRDCAAAGPARTCPARTAAHNARESPTRLGDIPVLAASGDRRNKASCLTGRACSAPPVAAIDTQRGNQYPPRRRWFCAGGEATVEAAKFRDNWTLVQCRRRRSFSKVAVARPPIAGRPVGLGTFSKGAAMSLARRIRVAACALMLLLLFADRT